MSLGDEAVCKNTSAKGKPLSGSIAYEAVPDIFKSMVFVISGV